MLIMGQNREGVVNIQNAFEIYVEENYEWICARTGASGFLVCLGEYGTRERCREVLSDICEQYQRFLNFPGAEGNAVFLMPEE